MVRSVEIFPNLNGEDNEFFSSRYDFRKDYFAHEDSPSILFY